MRLLWQRGRDNSLLGTNSLEACFGGAGIKRPNQRLT